MAIRLSTYAWGTPRRRGEGLRLSCTRYLPRGIKKGDYAERNYLDVWLPTLAPSKELLSWARREGLDSVAVWRKFRRRYRQEMAGTDARQTIRALAALAKRTPISIGCSCHGPHCHRFELERLIRAAADEEL